MLRIWASTKDQNGNTSSQTVYIHGPNGRRLGHCSIAESLTAITATCGSWEVYFGGKRVALVNYGVATYTREDRLGSTGKYFPYGEVCTAGPANDPNGLASYANDSITGLDYADQRYFSSINLAICTFW